MGKICGVYTEVRGEVPLSAFEIETLGSYQDTAWPRRGEFDVLKSASILLREGLACLEVVASSQISTPKGRDFCDL